MNTTDMASDYMFLCSIPTSLKKTNIFLVNLLCPALGLSLVVYIMWPHIAILTTRRPSKCFSKYTLMGFIYKNNTFVHKCNSLLVVEMVTWDTIAFKVLLKIQWWPFWFWPIEGVSWKHLNSVSVVKITI